MDLVWPFMECAREVAFLLMILVYVSSLDPKTKIKEGENGKEKSPKKAVHAKKSENPKAKNISWPTWQAKEGSHHKKFWMIPQEIIQPLWVSESDLRLALKLVGPTRVPVVWFRWQKFIARCGSHVSLALIYDFYGITYL